MRNIFKFFIYSEIRGNVFVFIELSFIRNRNNQLKSSSITKFKFMNYQWCLRYFTPILTAGIKFKDPAKYFFLLLDIAKTNNSFK